MTRYTFQKALATLAFLLPLSASAYLTPEEVLLHDDFYAPPTAREAQDRVEGQAKASSDRREQIQEPYFEEQRKLHSNTEDGEPQPETSEETTSGEGNFSTLEMELLRTIRLLKRVEQNQHASFNIDENGNVLHSGAGPLAPTGAGAVMSAVLMLGAGAWTLRKAKKAEDRK
jgi:hypothetical protein